MSINDISITATGVIESTIIYGIVHTIWIVIKWVLKHLESEAGHVINEHISAGHKSRFKYCLEGRCSKVGTGIDSLRLLGR